MDFCLADRPNLQNIAFLVLENITLVVIILFHGVLRGKNSTNTGFTVVRYCARSLKFFGLSSFEQGYQLLKLIARMAIKFLATISITGW